MRLRQCDLAVCLSTARRFSLALASFCLAANAFATEPVPMKIASSHVGPIWNVEVDFVVPATVPEVWGVLTDFDHMSTFLPNLEVSRVLERKDNHLKIEQKGNAYYGPFSMSFQSVRDIELLPISRIVAHTRNGSVKFMESVANIEADGERTHVHYHASWEPAGWWAHFLGVQMVNGEVERQFLAMTQEMLKRHEVLSTAGNGLHKAEGQLNR